MKTLAKIIAVLVGLLASAVLGAWYLVTVPVWTSPISRDALTSADRLRDHVIALSEGIGGRSHNQLDRLDKAADYIFQQFETFDTPLFQDYEARGQAYKNVILRLKGTQDCGNHHYVVGAHYDTEGDKPGADDNASGVAGLIELARAIKQHPLPCDVELVAYSLEEPPNFRTPNMGSHHHAYALEQRSAPPTLMISLEMIGYFSDESNSQHYPVDAMKYAYGDQGDFIGIVGDMDNRGPIRDVKRSFLQTNRIKTKAISAPSFVEGIDFSDHRNYVKFGFPAIMVTDTAFYRNANYHRLTDTHDTLDYQRMSAVVDSVYYVLKDIIGTPRP